MKPKPRTHVVKITLISVIAKFLKHVNVISTSFISWVMFALISMKLQLSMKSPFR